MKIKKIMTSSIAIILAITSFSLTAGAAVQTKDVDAKLKALAGNTLISSAKKTTANTSYDSFSWTGGTTENLNVWIENSSDYIVGPKVKITKGTGYTKIPYRDGMTFQTGATAYMYAEQSGLTSKTLIGSAKFS